jgi:SAM-dependent methyltransferase
MGWRKYLLIPQLTWYAARAPRDQRKAWERYWSGVDRTGVAGDVLWDADDDAELARIAELLRTYADPALPLVDLGCGNGRQARALAGTAARVLGVDGSAAAVRRAEQESAELPAGRRPEFRLADVTEPGLGARLAAELGECTVHIRGVLHVLTPAQRAAVAENVAALAGRRGVVVVRETDAADDPLAYLVRQGATPTSMPDVVRRCVAAGIRPPSHFGAAELAAVFPAARWEVLEAGPGTLRGVPLRPGEPVQTIPAYHAVLRAAPA